MGLQSAVFREGQRQPRLTTQDPASRSAGKGHALSLRAGLGSVCLGSVMENAGPFCQYQNISSDALEIYNTVSCLTLRFFSNSKAKDKCHPSSY